jgi:chromosome segregation ATPase
MDLDQLTQKIEWLDEERRADKITISSLQERVAALEGRLKKADKEIAGLDSEVTTAKTFVKRIEKFDDALNAHRTEVKKETDKHNENAKKREATARKRVDEDVDAINKTLKQFENQFKESNKLRIELIDRKAGQQEVERLVSELRETVKKMQEDATEASRTTKTLQDEVRGEARRLNDAQGEVSALRKRVDEHKVIVQLLDEDAKKREVRINEIMARDNERRESMNNFMDKVNTTQADQERTWKSWKKEFTDFETQMGEFRGLLQNLGDTERQVKGAQQQFEEITDQIKRRISEITEMQRLGEERFRQEWATFKADDQKRWTNYTLTQEELQRETSRQLERLAGQSTDLDESLQELQDIVTHISEQNEKMLQTFLGNLRDWVQENERFLGSVR